MPVIMTHGTSITNDTRYTLVIMTKEGYKVELRPGHGASIREFNAIAINEMGNYYGQNPNEKVEIGLQTPDNHVSLKYQDDRSSITFSYRATETEVKTIRFGGR